MKKMKMNKYKNKNTKMSNENTNEMDIGDHSQTQDRSQY
jgi:hypothetical protein